jgi:hypothetical protein
MTTDSVARNDTPPPWPLSARLAFEAMAEEADDLRRSVAELEALLESFAQTSTTYREAFIEALAALAVLTRQLDQARRTITRLHDERRAAHRRAA